VLGFILGIGHCKRRYGRCWRRAGGCGTHNQMKRQNVGVTQHTVSTILRVCGKGDMVDQVRVIPSLSQQTFVSGT
jgi:hypothetical protein